MYWFRRSCAKGYSHGEPVDARPRGTRGRRANITVTDASGADDNDSKVQVNGDTMRIDLKPLKADRSAR
jgi:hypothetical protein